MIIKRISADYSNFRGNRAHFTTGLNVILADRHVLAKDRDTTNGAGKTTLLEIIHFCLGKNVSRDRDSIFNKDELQGHRFDVQFHDDTEVLSVSRTVGTKVITVLGNDSFNARLKSDFPREMSIRDFNEWAGNVFFDLDNTNSEKYHPNFRALLSYLVRVGKDAYNTPFANTRKQSAWDEQVSTTFLLGLSPVFAGRWQQIRDEDKKINLLKQIASSERSDKKTSTRAYLFAQLTRLRQRVSQELEQLQSFRVHERYHELESEANQLTTNIHQLTNENVTDEQMIEYYESVRSEERNSDELDVERVYDEAHVIFPELVKKRLSDVKEFHREIISNRQQFLLTEIDMLKKRIIVRRQAIQNLSEQLSNIMNILSSHGALDDFTAMQGRYLKTLAELQKLEDEYNSKIDMDEGKKRIKKQKSELVEKALRDLMERKDIFEQAILLFNQNSQALYQEPGDLLIEVTPSGYKFGVQIDRARSQGISNMKIFCYDLTIMQLEHHHRFPKFLIHDSLIFDGVDGRQKAKAIELAARESKRLGFQYIMTINRDDIPWDDFTEGFKEEFKSFIRLELSDKGDEGLLGFQVR